MATTFEIMLAALQQMNKSHSRTGFTSGVGTITDLLTGASDDDYWTGGVVFYYVGTALKCSRVTDFVASTGVITHDGGDTALTTALYWIYNGRWSKDDMLMAFNAAQRTMGPIMFSDDIPITASTDAYAVNAYEIARVCILLQESPDVLSEPYRYWRQDANSLVVDHRDFDPYVGKNMRVWHNEFLTDAGNTSQTIPSYIDPERFKWETVLQAALQRGAKVGMDEPQIPQLVQLAQSMRTQTKRPPRMQIDARYSRW